MAEKKTIQECCKDAIMHMGREKEKLRALLKMLDGKEEIHLDAMELAGIRYMLEDAIDGMERVLVSQCALAISAAGERLASAEASRAETATAREPIPMPGNDR